VPHHISSGVERYVSLASSADGRRLAATVSRSTAQLWRLPIRDRVVEESDATAVQAPGGHGLSPRAGPGYIIHRGPKGGTDAAIAPGGQRLAIAVHRRGVTHLYVLNADGTGARRVAAELDVRGAPAWSPDGQWLAAAAHRDGEPHLFKIPANGGPAALLVREYSTDPIWAPSGQFLVYSGADVGTTFPVKAVSADGTPRPLPPLILTRGARRFAFLRNDDVLVVMKGDISHREFWLVDLTTGSERQLTSLGREFVIGDFDVSADGRDIIFDRTREESDIVLFDLRER
jgi:Tol biopolymer transport system component